MKKTVLFCLLLFPISVYAETLYVTSARGKLLDGPGFKHKLVSMLGRGDQLNVIERQKRWIKVEHEGKSGWISQLLVSDKPPMGRVSVIEEKETEQQKATVRKRASAASSSAAARGLREDERARLSDAKQENYQALEKMEQHQVEEAEVERFSSELNQ